MSCLNEKTEFTQKIIHLLTTTMCNRNCKYCCNKSYDLNEVEYVTHEELSKAEIICLTGGEPFLFTNPCEMGKYYKRKYKNIQRVYVYTNAVELWQWLQNNELYGIDGLNISIKTKADAIAFDRIIADFPKVKELASNLLYIFDNLYPTKEIESFKVFNREWQIEFEPANDSIFRRC